MFFGIFKSTVKTLLRSVVFWILLCVVLVVMARDLSISSFGKYDLKLDEIIYDTDPRFVLDYQSAIQRVINSLSGLLFYIIPIVVITTTVLTLNRDYGDKFFEIEKAAGIRPMVYLSARISALTALNFAVTVVGNCLAFYLYVYTRGGIEGMSVWECLADTLPRLLRNCLLMGLPCVLFYICLTYCVGALFKNGLPGAIAGLSYVIFGYVHDLYNVANAGVFMEYIRPNAPEKLFRYLYYYDTEWFEPIMQHLGTSLVKALTCVGILLGTSLLFFLISYFRIRKRTV